MRTRSNRAGEFEMPIARRSGYIEAVDASQKAAPEKAAIDARRPKLESNAASARPRRDGDEE